MIYVDFPSTPHPRPLNWYLAAEEWLARHGKPGDEFFFLWQVEPTIICGRNQVVENEVDVDYCRSHGVNMVRRRSGGGAVYADMDNVMFSYVTLSHESGATVPTTFAHYTTMVAAMLRSLGLNATSSTRNDVWIDSRKVSGYAFYNLPQAAIVHGTMLYDFDPEAMSRCLTPSRAKLSSKGVKSVQSHVTTIREHLPQMSLEEFKQKARDFMGTQGEILLDAHAVAEIDDLAARYERPEWLWRMHSDRPLPPVQRVEGVGEFVADVDTEPQGRITRVNLMGDFFLLSDLDESLLAHLVGVERSPRAIERALEEKGIDVSRVIHEMDNPTIARIIGTQPEP